MRDHPETLHLLESARRALVQSLIPSLQGEAKLTALMLARTLTVVSARLKTDSRIFFDVDSGRVAPELEALANLLGVAASSARMEHGGTVAAIDQLSRQLVSEIRNGQYDFPSTKNAALHHFLLLATREKIVENNPKALESFDCETGAER